MGNNLCQPYFDVEGRKTDLIHIAEGNTYPINILGNAATADVANNPIVDLSETDNVVAFRSGDETEDKANEYKKTINNVDHAVSATTDIEGNDIIKTYAKKDEVVVLDPETGKVPTDILPDTTNNVNFVNGKTGDVTLNADDIPYNAFTSTKTKIDAIVDDTNAAIEALNENKAEKSELPNAGFELTQNGTEINAYRYSLATQSGEMSLVKSDSEGNEVDRDSVAINAIGVFNFAPANLFDVATNLHVRINWGNVGKVYNMGYLQMMDKSAGTWTIHNDGNDPIYVMRFGGRFNSGARISPMPSGVYIASNQSTTFYLDSDDPYLDRNSFGLLVWKLATEE